MTLTFDLTPDLDLWCFKVKFWESCESRIVGLIDVKWKGYWADYMTFPLTTPMTFTIGLSRSESKVTLSREWDGRLTWNAKGASHPFMTKISTNVTMVGWAHVPDRDRGDFRHRRALDISSFYNVHSLTTFIHRSCMPRQVRRKNIKLHWWYLNPTAYHGLRIRISAGPEWKSGSCIYTGQARNYP